MQVFIWLFSTLVNQFIHSFIHSYNYFCSTCGAIFFFLDLPPRFLVLTTLNRPSNLASVFYAQAMVTLQLESMLLTCSLTSHQITEFSKLSDSKYVQGLGAVIACVHHEVHIYSSTHDEGYQRWK